MLATRGLATAWNDCVRRCRVTSNIVRKKCNAHPTNTGACRMQREISLTEHGDARRHRPAENPSTFVADVTLHTDCRVVVMAATATVACSSMAFRTPLPATRAGSQ